MISVRSATLLAGERVDDGEAVDGVAEHLDAQHRLLVGGVHLDGVAPHPELAPAERHVVAVVLHVDQAAQDGALVVVDAGVELEQLAPVLLRVAHAVDAADAGDDDHVPPGEQRRRRRVAQPVDLVVDRAVLLDVGVAGGDVGLGLVVVVVADEVLDPVLREELLELRRQLRGEALVRGQDQRGPLHLLDRPGDGGALAAAGDAQQRLEAVAPLDARRQLPDGLGLVARRFEVGDDLERRHGAQPIPPERLFAAPAPSASVAGSPAAVSSLLTPQAGVRPPLRRRAHRPEVLPL